MYFSLTHFLYLVRPIYLFLCLYICTTYANVHRSTARDAITCDGVKSVQHNNLDDIRGSTLNISLSDNNNER